MAFELTTQNHNNQLKKYAGSYQEKKITILIAHKDMIK